jgi:hypothetical protein
MCTTDVYTEVYPDGHKKETRRQNRCTASRYGSACLDPIIYKHPQVMVQYGEPTTTIFPPSPRHTPRTATPIYQSGNESERSSKSSNSKKRSSGVYVNGQKILDFGRKNRDHHSRRNERILIVDTPPTPRTPPQAFVMPHTAPPSPNLNTPLTYNIVDAPARRERLTPVIVDERPRPRPHVEIHVNEHSHRRHHSSSSHNSHNSHSSAASDEERRRRRDERDRAQAEIRRQKLRARINAANEEISRRPAVPVPSMPTRSSAAYVRPGVELTVDREAELVDAVRQLDLGKQMLRRSRERADLEEEAQRVRLMERMMPRRRATVGPGSRRHRVAYDDGIYRWE